MRYFVDEEFVDDGKTIDLISIGIVCEDGREFYAQSCESYWYNASQWVQDHVYGHLLRCPSDEDVYISQDTHQFETQGKCHLPHCPWCSREQIKQEVTAFMDPKQYGKPELWGWCTGYDWVALCQLFGTMMDIPAGWPHHINDLQQILDERGISDDELPQQEESLHNALSDARHLKKLWGYVVRNDCWQ